jgi:hypothetical protein
VLTYQRVLCCAQIKEGICVSERFPDPSVPENDFFNSLLATPPNQQEALWRSPFLKKVGGIASASILVGGTFIGLSHDKAQADNSSVVTHHVYRTGDDGVWLHESPGISAPLEVVMSEGDEFGIECFTPGGDMVNGNGLWLTGTYDGKHGSVTDYYIDTHWKTVDDLRSQGIPQCGEEGQPEQNSNLQPAEIIQPFVSYDRGAAKNWALEHATDTPPNAGSCTWFVSQALAEGGVPQNSTWNITDRRVTKDGIQNGTDTAWKTSDFLAYVRNRPYVKVEELGQLKIGFNNIPDAKNGDVIVYDWEDDGYPDHADVVTGSAENNSKYPLVSGWSEDSGRALPYSQRGWTWSVKNNQFLQKERDATGRYVNWEMSATLIHFNSEEELNIS